MLLTPRFTEAISFAAQLHRNHVRKGTSIPYISHLLAVCSLVLEHGGSEDQAIAALLHDAIEDQAERFGGAEHLQNWIETHYGQNVLEIVLACTDADIIPKPPWRERKEAYIKHIRHMPEDARLVSMADKLHNARCILADYDEIGESIWNRFTGGKEGTLWYYRALVTAFQETAEHPLVLKLNRVVAELEARAASPATYYS